MRVAARRKGSPRARVSRVSSIPAPVRGWNARDSIAVMKPDDAVRLINFLPTASDIMLRKGEAAHATGIVNIVETLMTYRPMTGAQTMHAFTDAGEIFDVSSAGAVGAAAVTGLTNGQWRSTMYTTTAGTYALCVNGVDDMLQFDGATWTALNTLSTPAITGLATASIVNINVHKARVWYIEKNSLSAWYAGAGAYAGALSEFDMSGIFKLGGALVAMGSWTLDAGSGVDDLAIFITDQGEVAVYQGTDPSSANTWALVGVFRIGAPVGYNCLLKFGGDLLILTTDGVVAAGTALSGERAAKNNTVSDRIQVAITGATTDYGDNYGWQLEYFPGASMLMVNVPVATGSEEQYVMNTKTQAWTRFQGWDAKCWTIFNDALYYGMTDEVRNAWTGTTDVDSGIAGEAVSAFWGHRSSGAKTVKMIRPIIAYDQNPSEISFDVNVDYNIENAANLVSLPQQTAGVWDTGEWDVALWGGSPLVRRDWYGASGVGIVLAPHLDITSTSAQFRLSAYDLLIEDGEVL